MIAVYARRGIDKKRKDVETMCCKKGCCKDGEKKNIIVCVLAIIGVIVAVAAIAYAVYKFVTPDYLEDFDEDFDDDFDDYFSEEDPV